MVDFKFIDLPGLWQHFSIPVEEFVEDLFSEGIGFDGSSIRGFQRSTSPTCCCCQIRIPRFWTPPAPSQTLSIICDVIQPARWSAIRATAVRREKKLKRSDRKWHRHDAYFGPEVEFYIF